MLLSATASLAQNGGNNGGSTPNYQGSLDHAGCDYIGGWAADANSLNNSIQISLWIDGQLVTTIPANASRPDVGNYLGDNGLHGFTLPTLASLLDGQSHTVRVTFQSSNLNLTNSPAAPISCANTVAPLCVDLVTTVTPFQGQPSSQLSSYCRDQYGSTRYDFGRFSTIDDQVNKRTIFLDRSLQVAAVMPWAGSYIPPDQAYAYPTYASLTAPAPDPPPHPPAGCPTGNQGWSVKSQPPPNSPQTSVPQATVNVWACPSLRLPMYVEVIGSDQSTTEFEMQNITTGNPDPQLFTLPAGYVVNNSLPTEFTPGPGCAPQATRAQFFLVTTSQHLGQTVATYITDGYPGCSFTDAVIVAGQTMTATVLTPRNQSVFQVLLSDSGNPQYPNAVDFATLKLVASDGTTASSLIVRVAIN
jgi:hypothetical protein